MIPLYSFCCVCRRLSLLQGSGTISTFDMSDMANPTKVDSLNSKTLFTGIAMMPKYAVDVYKGEIDRLYKLTNTAIEKISCIITRKVSSMA